MVLCRMSWTLCNRWPSFSVVIVPLLRLPILLVIGLFLLAKVLTLHTRVSFAIHEENALQILKRISVQQLDPALGCVIERDDDDGLGATPSSSSPLLSPIIIAAEELNYDTASFPTLMVKVVEENTL